MRPSIFPCKDTHGVQASKMTTVGLGLFERARKRLAALSGWELARVTDADTIEYLVRGHEASVAELKKRSA